MIRALVTLIVGCLVAATGVRPQIAAHDQLSTLTAPRGAERLHARPVHALAPRRTASHAPSLTAIVVVGMLPLIPPPACLEDTAAGPSIVVDGAVAPRSARGPPIA